MKLLVIFLMSGFLINQSYALSLVNEMDAISYKNYIGFEQKWKLVTVRYRKDTGEMRFTYANKLAYKTLKEGKTNYPEGSVFGKIGIKTEEDPLFASSAVPGGVRRYQLMVKNTVKYKNNNGWGYALFNEDGLLYPENPEKQVEACAACHNAASERGYVFSQLINLDKNSKSIKTATWLPNQLPIKFNFETSQVNILNEKIKNLIPEEVKEIRVLKGEIAANIFQGTLEEIRPVLSKETFDSKLPTIVFSDDQKRFSLIIIEKSDSTCLVEGKSGIYLKSIYTNLNNEKNSELHFCYSH